MRPLREREWIEERNEKKNNEKGRPLKYYRLVVPFEDIVASFESDALQKEKEMSEALAQLKELSTKSR